MVKNKVFPYIKKNWKNCLNWLLGTIVVILLTKTCDRIWPDAPVVVKEHTDTVKVIHTISPFPTDSDSVIKKQIEQQLMNIELLDRYEKQIKKRTEDDSSEPCKMILGNPYPGSSGYSINNASPFCLIELRHNAPVIDIAYSFIRQDYIGLIKTLGVKISKRNDREGRDYIIFDHNYEPQSERKDMLVRIVDDLQPGTYTIEAGFILKEDSFVKYPSFYRRTFTLKK